MKLMSSLLLCTFVLMAPQALAEKIVRTDWDTIYNDTIKRQKPSTHNKILLNINAPPLVNVVSEVQVVFADAACQNCINCMERAIKADKINSHKLDIRPSSEELQTEVLTDRYGSLHRYKRGVKNITEAIKTKKAKSKKRKIQKSVTVTRYNVDGEPYVLKIKETITHINDVRAPSTNCQVYNVKNSFFCDTPEGEMLLTAAKRKGMRKVNKKTKTEKEIHNVITTTKKSVPLFRKRQVDNSQVPENFMPSIEELY